MEKIINQNSFNGYSFHDNHIHGFSIIEGDHGCGNLVLDIDHITEWISADNGSYDFMVAPALLTFHDVFNLKIFINYQAAPAATQPPVINTITYAEEFKNEHSIKNWVIELNWPHGEIMFEASGFELQVRSDSIKCNDQSLDVQTRNKLLNQKNTT